MHFWISHYVIKLVPYSYTDTYNNKGYVNIVHITLIVITFILILIFFIQFKLCACTNDILIYAH